MNNKKKILELTYNQNFNDFKNDEKWKNIKNYEWIYMVSNLWRIKSLSRQMRTTRWWKYNTKEKILNFNINNKRGGYLPVCLYKNWKQNRQRIHRLVALHFIKNLKNKPEVNHEDWNKNNNKKSNLKWVTKSENEIHKYNTLRYKCHNNKQISAYKKWKRVNKYDSIKKSMYRYMNFKMTNFY